MTRIPAAALAAALALTSLIAPTSAGAHAPAVQLRPAAAVPAQGDPVGGSGNLYFLNDQFTGKANIELQYGISTDVIHFGDWDGNGTDTPMIQRGNIFHVRNSNTSGPAEFTFVYGDPGDKVLVGDWDGNGTDTLAIRRNDWFYIRNTMTSGVADLVFSYGNPGDKVLVGDWDGNGTDTLAVRRNDWFHVRNTLTSGVADLVFSYGNPGDVVLVGDWDGNGTDTLAVRRGITYYLRNSTTSGVANVTFNYGEPTDTAFTGDWNGDGADTIGVRRPPAPPPPPTNPALFVYGTLRHGQPAYSTYLAGHTTSESPGRLQWHSMYIYGTHNSVWALPDTANAAGIIGEHMFIRSSDYSTVLARIDAYELYYPSNPDQSSYIRTKATTAQGVTVWVYVAATRLRSVIRGEGTFIASGDYFDYLRRW